MTETCGEDETLHQSYFGFGTYAAGISKGRSLSANLADTTARWLLQTLPQKRDHDVNTRG